jgi:hypothetical protein
MKRIIMASILALVVLVAFVPFSNSEMATQGTGSTTNMYSTSYKVIPLEKDIMIITYESLGVLINDSGEGAFNNMSTYNVGIIYFEKGVGKLLGYMTCTDKDGDKTFIEINEDATKPAPNPNSGTGKFIGGTGKYTGIEGTMEYKRWDLRPAAKGTSQGISKTKATWKIVEKLASSQEEGITWIGQAEGVAKDGIFKRTATPSFSFQYPLGSTKVPTNSPLQIMKMQTPSRVIFNACLVKIPEQIKLEEFGPKYITSLLQKFGSDVKVISNKEIKLKCGSRAYRTDIKWNWGGTFPLNSLIVSAYKEGQCIWVAAHPEVNSEEFAPIVQSLTLK